MKRKGASYDVGSVMGFNWRPGFSPEHVQREPQITNEDLRCNAVIICALGVGRT